jgi:hypothetical protein
MRLRSPTHTSTHAHFAARLYHPHCFVFTPPLHLPAGTPSPRSLSVSCQAECEALSRRQTEALGRKAALSSDVSGLEEDLEKHVASLQVSHVEGAGGWV